MNPGQRTATSAQWLERGQGNKCKYETPSSGIYDEVDSSEFSSARSEDSADTIDRKQIKPRSNGRSLYSARQKKLLFRKPESYDAWKQFQGQLYNLFVEDCQPNRNRMRGCFTSLMEQTDTSPKPLALIVSALSILHAVSKHQRDSPALLHEAAKLYGDAMSSLRHCLQLANQSKRKPSALPYLALSILLTSLYSEPEWSGRLDTPPSMSWITHLDAAARYLGGVGPQAFTSTIPEAATACSILIVHYKSNLSLRRKMAFDTDVLWTMSAISTNTTHISIHPFHWFRIAWPLPGLLELADVHLRNPYRHIDESTFHLIKRLFNIRRDIHDYAEEILAEHTSIEDPVILDPEIDEHYFMAENPMFQPQFAFDELCNSKVYIMTWISCLSADCTLLRLLGSIEKPDTSLPSEQTIEENALNAATHLCQILQFLSDRDSLTYLHTIITILQMAGRVFAQLGKAKEAAWCQACEQTSWHRYRRLSPSKPRSLCRITNVAPALIAAVEFESYLSSCPISRIARMTSPGSKCPITGGIANSVSVSNIVEST